MVFENEKKILKIIKFAPIIFVLSISFILFTITFLENTNRFKKEEEKIKLNYISKNKELIKNRTYETYEYIKREQELTKKELLNSLKESVQLAYTIANSIYEKNQDKTQEEIKRLIINALRDIRFNEGRGYFFIYEKNGKNILLPHNKTLEGKNFWRHQDAKGNYIIQDMTRLLEKKDEAFYEWYWFNPTNPDFQRKKVGLIKNFEQFNWFIGTGEYVDNIEKKIQKRILEHIQRIRFENNGYIFVIKYDGTYLSHFRKKYIGKNTSENNDTTSSIKDTNIIINIAKKGEGYYSYIQNKKPETNTVSRKISFVKGIDEWSWLIGMGFYEDDVNKVIKLKKEQLDEEFQSYFINMLKFAFAIIIILLLITLYVTNIIKNRFTRYKNQIKKHIKEKTEQQNIISQQSKMATMGEMIGNIAHQWRQPLSSISTLSTGLKLQKEMNLLNDKMLIESLDNIHKSTQYLSNTIDDFRDFFKTNKIKKKFLIQDSIKKAISLVHAQFYNHEIQIINNEANFKIQNFENELIQVILNILNNSKDELIKKDKSSKRIVFIDLIQKNKTIEICIKDNAGGIKKEIINKIFEPYFTTKKESHGTGIGLYMSKIIIEKNMLGKLEVQNIEYKYEDTTHLGAQFKITLPL